MIHLQNIVKEFHKPVRGKGFWGMLRTLFSRKFTTIVAVNDICLDIAEGESVGYIGANGAGKSTTIKMMCGILTPTSGTLTVDGMRPYDRKTRNKVLRNIGVVFGQKTQLWFDLPLTESFALLKNIYEVPDDQYNERLAFLTEVLELDKFVNQPVRTLSLGQRMRADLAASMLHNPRVLFLDEPTIGLDVVVKRRLIQAIQQMRAKYNTTLILTTHAMSDIEDLCSRVVIIDEGRIIFDGDLSTLRRRYGDKRTVSVQTREALDVDQLRAELGQGILDVVVEEPLTRIIIDAQVLPLNKLLGWVMSHCEMLDLQIRETDIEQVVAHIYESKKA